MDWRPNWYSECDRLAVCDRWWSGEGLDRTIVTRLIKHWVPHNLWRVDKQDMLDEYTLPRHVTASEVTFSPRCVGDYTVRHSQEPAVIGTLGEFVSYKEFSFNVPNYKGITLGGQVVYRRFAHRDRTFVHAFRFSELLDRSKLSTAMDFFIQGNEYVYILADVEEFSGALYFCPDKSSVTIFYID